MFKQMLKIILMLAVVGGASGAPYGGWLIGAEAYAATITLPKTGQTKCYDPTGATTNEVACTGTGQDANKLKNATTSAYYAWYMNGITLTSSNLVATGPAPWQFVGK